MCRFRTLSVAVLMSFATGMASASQDVPAPFITRMSVSSIEIATVALWMTPVYSIKCGRLPTEDDYWRIMVKDPNFVDALGIYLSANPDRTAILAALAEVSCSDSGK